MTLQNDLHNPDNHNGVITHLEPDILECEVKWALGSIITNKASGVDGIPVELFQILKDDAVKALHSICQQIWKTQQWPQDLKRSVFIPFLKKGNAKECSEELYKKDLYDPDNHDGMITHLEPDILKCEAKSLESITTNKTSEGDGILVEQFQILKDDAAKLLF